MSAPPATLEAQIAALQPVLLRFALRSTRDPELSRDLVQEALVSALAGARDFAGRSSLRTWLIGILAHKVMDHFRRRARHGEDEAGDDPDLLAAPPWEDVERVLIARRELSRVEAGLGRLPDRERMVLLLCDVEELDRAACCRALGVTATHLRVLLHRARNRLRRMLEEP